MKNLRKNIQKLLKSRIGGKNNAKFLEKMRVILKY